MRISTDICKKANMSKNMKIILKSDEAYYKCMLRIRFKE